MQFIFIFYRLLEAYLELDGFITPPSIEALSAKSWHVLSRYPKLKTSDLSDRNQQLNAESSEWQKYWLNNPINALVGGNTKKDNAWFSNIEGKLVANFTVETTLIECFQDFVKELVDLQLAKYANREQKKSEPLPIQNAVNDETLLPYYPNLKIACGYFKTGTNDDAELMPVHVNNVSPDKHFLARASGNSMNGGKSPIYDGDLLLLEFVTPTSAGSITGLTMAVEMQDESGDDQYLLRVVQKDDQGQYWLKANNPDYALMPANESMKTFARLKQVIRQ